MNRFLLLSHLLCILILNISCNRTKKDYVKNENSADLTIRISGSNSEYELVKSLLNEFNRKNSNLPIRYELEGNGSEIGIEKFLKGEVNMCMSSRKLKPFECNLLKSNGISFLEIAFATDALVFITNYRNSVDSLSIDQIRDILSGKIINWFQICKFKGPIKIYGRNTMSGTFHFVEDKFKIPGLRKFQITCNSSNEIIEQIMNDSFGIGYISVGYLFDEQKKLKKNLWPVPVFIPYSKQSAVSPLEYQSIMKNLYPVCRPLYQYFRLPMPDILQKFLRFELSEEGQKFIESQGFYRVNPFLQMQNNIQLTTLTTEKNKF